LTWWLALKNNITNEMLEVVTRLFTAVASSSAGIERIFFNIWLSAFQDME